MELFCEIWQAYGLVGIALMLAVVMLFIAQICWHCGIYSRVTRYRLASQPRRHDEAFHPDISIVVPLFGENGEWVETGLPRLMGQRYDHRFEVVVVYVGNDNDFYEDLLSLHRIYGDRLVTTRINYTSIYKISTKQALNVGMKAARCEYIITTSTEALPSSNTWLSIMAKGFERGDVVLGYSSIRRCTFDDENNIVYRRDGFAGFLMREYHVAAAIRWIAAASKGNPFGASRHNMGFTRTQYFAVGGYNFLRLNVGEDDLFIRHLCHTTGERPALILSPRSTCTEHILGGWRQWVAHERNSSLTHRYYPSSMLWSLAMEYLSRLLFFVVALVAIIVLPMELALTTAGIVLLRYALVLYFHSRRCRRLGERGLVLFYMLFDVVEPMLHLYIVMGIRKGDENKWR